MNQESYCAKIIKMTEGESFVSVGDKHLDRDFKSNLLKHCRNGQKLSLPDLVSHVQLERGKCFRVREVKFRLEERLILKAVRQLYSGVLALREFFGKLEVDRLEIVIPLSGRSLKSQELNFLGESLEANRYLLKMDEQSNIPVLSDCRAPITVLIL